MHIGDILDKDSVDSAVKGKDYIFILTDTAAYISQFVGPPFTFSIRKVGSNCGLIGKHALVYADGVIYWMADSGGFFVQPTIFDDVKPDNTIFSEEVFGPVLGITTFNNSEEAIALANQNKYGLAASVFTSSNKTAHVAARKIKAGTVAVNCYGEGDITTPFGGYKLSGFGGRDKSLAAHDQYCELKTIWIDLK